MASQSRRSSDKIDFKRLGFDICIPGQPKARTKSLPGATVTLTFSSGKSSCCHGDISLTNQEHVRSSASNLNSAADEDNNNGPVPNIPIEQDNISDLDIFDDDSSYGSEYSTDDEGPPKGGVAPTRARQLRNHTFASPVPRRSFQNSVPHSTDLGYDNHEPETPESLGYRFPVAPTKEELGYNEDSNKRKDRRRSSNLGVQLASVKGQVLRNRRTSNSMSRRKSRVGRLSAGSSGSSMSSYASEQRARRHSKSRPSHRERMVTRSVSRRLSRKHPAQLEVVRRQSTATGCRGYLGYGEDQEETAIRQTLQDLGCSELVLDPTRQRMPRRVSLEYNNDDAGTVCSSHCPKSVCVEFGDCSSIGTPTSRRSIRRPRRVSIGYVQREVSENEVTGKRRLLKRRGSLDFSVGTSTLPRRGSAGGAMQYASPDLHHSDHHAAMSMRRYSLGRQVALTLNNSRVNSTRQRRASMGPTVLTSVIDTYSGRRNDGRQVGRQVVRNQNTTKANATQRRHASMDPTMLTALSNAYLDRWGDQSDEEDGGAPHRTQKRDSIKSVTSRRSSLGGSDKSLFSRRSSIGDSDKTLFSRRHSLSRIRRSKIGKPQHRLSLKHVGNVEYLTRDTLVGRGA